MSELQSRVNQVNFISKIDLKAGFRLLRMALGNEKCTAIKTKFRHYEYMVMPFCLNKAPATCQLEMNQISRPVLWVELVINPKVNIEDDGGIIVVAHIEDILIATRRSLETHHQQVGKVFDSLLENNMWVNLEKCAFDQKSVPFLGCIVDGSSIQMDPHKAKEIVDWPRPTNQKVVQQL